MIKVKTFVRYMMVYDFDLLVYDDDTHEIIDTVHCDNVYLIPTKYYDYDVIRYRDTYNHLYIRK